MVFLLHQVMVFAAEAFGFGIILIANLTAIQGFVLYVCLLDVVFKAIH